MRTIALALLTLTLGCGDSAGPKKPPPGAAVPSELESSGCGEEASGGDYTPEKGSATVAGRVRFEGEPPVRRPIDFGAEAYCKGAHSTPLLSELVVVGAEGGLANVFVQVKSGLAGWKFATPKEAKVIDQAGCAYVPHVLGLHAGQDLKIRNSDPLMHNIHAINHGTGKSEFNFAQTQKGAEATRTFPRPMIVHVKCEVHGWMDAYIHVVKHPFHAVTGEDGAFSLARLPPGTYQVEAWHEKLGTRVESVTLGEGETKEISFVFSK